MWFLHTFLIGCSKKWKEEFVYIWIVRCFWGYNEDIHKYGLNMHEIKGISLDPI
jgi:hypothetical protein